jgi:hypothetical protein
LAANSLKVFCSAPRIPEKSDDEDGKRCGLVGKELVEMAGSI